ncbi:MAG: chromosome segregation protein SMC, partial [Gallionella sp.]|nr:chromosome segregation protein SMC [Gallionella sp.]
FSLPYQQDKITLACRIDKKGGDWIRKYWVAEGEVTLEDIEQQGQEFGVRDYQRLLHSAGLSPAIARVLSLEQGQTDKLCELSPKELLELVFQVFGDKEVLERYQEARHHQEHTTRELDAVQQQLEALGFSLKTHELNVNRFLEWKRLNEERTVLVSETLPRLEHHLLQKEAENAGRTLQTLRRDWHAKRTERHALTLDLQVQQQTLQAAQLRKQAAHENEQVQQRALDVINFELGGWKKVVDQQDNLLRQISDVDGGKAADARELDHLENERDRLRLRIAELEQQQRQFDEMLENLAAGRRTDPADVANFRQALSGAGIAHDLLTDLVEIADPSWQAAVEAVLAPFAHIVLLAKEKDTEAAMALGEKLRYRHFIVPERTKSGLAPHGSLLEVVRFSQPVPEWLLRLLERIRRVEDTSAGAKLPRGEDWITRQGYLRERRGGRFAAPDQARFGKARLESLRQQRADLEKSLTPLRQQRDELSTRLNNLKAQLAGESASAQLAARAAEFSEARSHYDALAIQRRDNGVYQAQQDRTQADEAVIAADKALEKIRQQMLRLDKEIADKENRPARQDQAKRLRRLRANQRQLPATWRDATANQLIAEEWRDSTNIARRIHEIEARFTDESWETDASVIVLRDKIRDDYARQESDLATRRRDNEMARNQTDAAREQYIAVLRYTITRYVKNLKALGDMASIKVEHEPVSLANGDDVTLSQAGLAVRFDFDDKGFMGMNDGDASGGQQVMKSLILLVGLMMEESRPGGFVFIDEPFAHLDIVNIERVASFLKATRAQYLLTTPVTHNISVYDPSMLTLVTFKKRAGDAWAPRIGVLVREPNDHA